jgi:hypothetical protein
MLDDITELRTFVRIVAAGSLSAASRVRAYPKISADLILTDRFVELITSGWTLLFGSAF